MTKFLRATLAWLAGAGFAHAQSPACVYSETVVAETGAPAKSKVTLLGMTPAEGAELRKDMMLSVDVEFQVADFVPGEYYLIVMFPTSGRGSMSPNDPSNMPALTHPSGKARLCVPLAEVYEHPDMKWPLSMAVRLMRVRPDGSGSGDTSSRSVKFLSPDIPAEALERQANAPPEEYALSLETAASYFDQRNACYKVCIARFPATQPVFTKAFRAWETRHAKDIEFVARAKYAGYLRTYKGRTDVAARIDETMQEAQLKGYRSMTDAQLKQQCDWTLDELRDPEDLTDNAVGDELKIILDWHASHPLEDGP